MKTIFKNNLGQESENPFAIDLLSGKGEILDYFKITDRIEEKLTLSDLVNSQVDSFKILYSGDSAKIGSSGDSAQIGSSGDFAKIGSSGDSAQIGSAGYYAQIGSSGDSAQIGSAGYYAQIGSSGDSAQIGSAGYYAQIGSAGYYAKIGSSGDSAQIGSSGDSAQIAVDGNDSISFACGYNSMVKAKKGTWCSLAEYKNENDKIIPAFALSFQIGNEEYRDNNGKVLSEDKFYILKNKQICEIDFTDGVKSIFISERKIKDLTIKHCKEMSYEDKDIYIVTNGIISTHGDTKVKAMSDFRYKLDCEKENIEVVEKIKSTGMVSKDDYRKITGACEFGTNDFCERHNITEDEVSIDRVLELLSDNDFGSVKFKNYFEK